MEYTLEDLELRRSTGLVQAEIEDNCIEHGVRGILKHEDIMKMVANYSEEDKQARVYGKFQHLTGLVFKEFSRKYHVIKPFHISKEDFCVYERLDVHPRNPDACLWLAVDSQGTRYVIDELYDEMTTGELSSRVKEKAGRYRVVDRRIDPLAFIEDNHTKRSLAKDLDRLGLRYLPASKSRTHAIQSIHDNLDYRESAGELIKRPMLFIFNTCLRTIWEMEHWQYNEWTGKTAESRSRSEKPQDKDDHMMECLGRALIDNPTFTELEREYTESIQGGALTTDPYSSVLDIV